MRVGDDVVGGAVDEEVLEAPDEAQPEGAGPEGGRQPQVRVHVVHATHEQAAHQVKLGRVACLKGKGKYVELFLI